MKRLAAPVLLAVTTAFLAGCAPVPTVMPDGRQGLSVDCSGSYESWQICYRQAGEACPKGYDVISKDGDVNGNFGSGKNWSAGSVESTRTLMIVCK